MGKEGRCFDGVGPVEGTQRAGEWERKEGASMELAQLFLLISMEVECLEQQQLHLSVFELQEVVILF